MQFAIHNAADKLCVPSLPRFCARSFRYRGAFTLIELLVVIAIIGVLVALLLPAVQAAREAGRRTQCVNNVKQLSLAIANHENTVGRLPPGACGGTVTTSSGTTNLPLHAWTPFVLPYLEQQPIYDLYTFAQSYDHPANAAAVEKNIASLLCPSAPRRPANMKFGPSDYSIIMDVDRRSVPPGFITARSLYDGAMMLYYYPEQSCRMNQILDGASQTIVMSEVAGRPQLWQRRKYVTDLPVLGWATLDGLTPINLDGASTDGTTLPGPCAINCTNAHEVYAFHPGIAVFGFVDGHVQAIRETTDINVLADLVTRANNEVVSGNY